MVYPHYSNVIGSALADMSATYPGRVFLRESGGTHNMSAVHEDSPVKAIVCPEQRGTVPTCGACGICFSPATLQPVRFKGHARALRPDHAALTEGRPLFPHMLTEGDPLPLKRGDARSKIGPSVKDTVVPTEFEGAQIWCLTLPERTTCPRSCHHWADCYGNNMRMAKRHVPGPALLAALHRQISGWNPNRKYLIRLHVLGDFYSTDYVQFWTDILAEFPNVGIYGYTAHPLTEQTTEPKTWAGAILRHASRNL